MTLATDKPAASVRPAAPHHYAPRRSKFPYIAGAILLAAGLGALIYFQMNRPTADATVLTFPVAAGFL